MKSLIKAIVIATVLTAPIASIAQQSNAPLTRAQVQAELAHLKEAGYNPAFDVINDPAHSAINPAAHVEAAQARVAAQKEAAQGDIVSLDVSHAGRW
ncbi:DUF4148 domain-containing protein [Paraburkholderia phytofirmans]|uniref:DUF4148 domain-containing protein n=1 Tax=Paraburkholderia phytofirmans OLGA172 TaxID=1417228 RepID=A0A167W791_9BURK|nr:DUF4148 domain-containing protein [Paraburkholderia phytofirmans]ANB74623.1 hypothetical protein AYM40_08620 [Paraburkholderia phytofirmans OLGA172]